MSSVWETEKIVHSFAVIYSHGSPPALPQLGPGTSHMRDISHFKSKLIIITLRQREGPAAEPSALIILYRKGFEE